MKIAGLLQNPNGLLIYSKCPIGEINESYLMESLSTLTRWKAFFKSNLVNNFWSFTCQDDHQLMEVETCL